MSRRILRAGRSRHFEEPTVNLTPLIDVVFVILIMFILVAPMLELDQVELANAIAHQNEEPSAAAHESSPITIHVKNDNKILFNGQKATPEQLPTLFKQAKKRFPNARPQLFHDKKGHFGTYQSVKNAAESAGFKQMDIILKPS